jgi:hypothetical protein
MDPNFVEVKSALWQKLFVLPISLLFSGVGIASLLSPFIPTFHTTPRTGQVTPMGTSDIVKAIVLGLFMLVLAPVWNGQF